MVIEQPEFQNHEIIKLIKGTVVPRPIAWISSRGSSGVPNLAPFSYFNVISHNPVMFIISIGQGHKVGKEGDKDTLANIKESGDFVINMVSAALANQMQRSSSIYAKEESEFEKAGLTPVPGKMVQAPRVKEAPISMECTLEKVMQMGDFNQVIGKLVCYHIKEEVHLPGDKVNYDTYDPIGRLAANYTYVRDLFFPGEQ